MIGKYGPVIKETQMVLHRLYPKKNIDVKKLEAGEYFQLIDEVATSGGKLLGNYNDEPIYLKTGKYGIYTTIGVKINH